MRVFFTQQIDNNEQLYTHLVQVESDLVAILIAAADAEKLLKELQKGMQVAKVEVCWMGKEKNVAEAKYRDVE